MLKIIKRSFESTQIRFLFVGALNTAVGYGVYALFLYLKLHYSIALLLANVIAVVHSYLWNKYFTFRSPERSVSEILRFAGVYIVNYFMNVFIIYICVNKFGINAYLAGVVGMFFSTVLSYFGHNLITFRQKKAG